MSKSIKVDSRGQVTEGASLCFTRYESARAAARRVSTDPGVHTYRNETGAALYLAAGDSWTDGHRSLFGRGGRLVTVEVAS